MDQFSLVYQGGKLFHSVSAGETFVVLSIVSPDRHWVLLLGQTERIMDEGRVQEGYQGQQPGGRCFFGTCGTAKSFMLLLEHRGKPLLEAR